MRAHHDCRNGRDRRRQDLSFISAIGLDRRRNKDQRADVVNEDEIVESVETKIAEDYWKSLLKNRTGSW